MDVDEEMLINAYSQIERVFGAYLRSLLTSTDLCLASSACTVRFTAWLVSSSLLYN